MNKQIEDQLLRIFKSFDTDNNGFIQLSQIRKVAQALGEQISQEKAKKIMKRLDINKDGKISFDEFRYWWVNGFKGKLGKLVYLKAKSEKIGKNILKHLRETGTNMDSSTNSNQKSICKLQICFGQQKQNGLKVNLQLSHHSSKSLTKIQELKAMIPTLNPDFFNFFVVFPCKKGEQTKKQLLDFLNILRQEKFANELQNIEENDFFNLKINDCQKGVVLNMQINNEILDIAKVQLGAPQEIYSKITGQTNQYDLNLQFKTNFTLEQLLTQNNIVEILLKGFSLNFSLEISNIILAIIRESFQSIVAEQQSSQFILIIITLLKSLQFKLKLRSPQMVQKFFTKLGINDILKQTPNLEQFLQPYIQDPLFKQIKTDPQNFLNLPYRILSFVKNYINSGVIMLQLRYKQVFALKRVQDTQKYNIQAYSRYLTVFLMKHDYKNTLILKIFVY